MTTLYRCDICHSLIDPIEGDERTQLRTVVERGEQVTSESIDLCENCAPESAGQHVDWMTFQLEKLQEDR